MFGGSAGQPGEVGRGHTGGVATPAEAAGRFDGWVARLAETCPGAHDTIEDGAIEDGITEDGITEQGAAGLIDLLAELERVKAACAAAQARVTAAFVQTQAAEAARWRQAMSYAATVPRTRSRPRKPTPPRTRPSSVSWSLRRQVAVLATRPSQGRSWPTSMAHPHPVRLPTCHRALLCG